MNSILPNAHFPEYNQNSAELFCIQMNKTGQHRVKC